MKFSSQDCALLQCSRRLVSLFFRRLFCVTSTPIRLIAQLLRRSMVGGRSLPEGSGVRLVSRRGDERLLFVRLGDFSLMRETEMENAYCWSLIATLGNMVGCSILEVLLIDHGLAGSTAERAPQRAQPLPGPLSGKGAAR